MRNSIVTIEDFPIYLGGKVEGGYGVVELPTLNIRSFQFMKLHDSITRLRFHWRNVNLTSWMARAYLPFDNHCYIEWPLQQGGLLAGLYMEFEVAEPIERGEIGVIRFHVERQM